MPERGNDRHEKRRERGGRQEGNNQLRSVGADEPIKENDTKQEREPDNETHPKSPRPEAAEQTTRSGRKMVPPPRQRGIDPRGYDADQHAQQRRAEAGADQEHDDRHDHQDQTTVPSLDEQGGPEEEEQRGDRIMSPLGATLPCRISPTPCSIPASPARAPNVETVTLAAFLMLAADIAMVSGGFSYARHARALPPLTSTVVTERAETADTDR